MFARIGSFAVKYRIFIILFWVLAAVLLFFLAPSLSQVGSMQESSFLPQDSQSLRARELISQYFPESQAASTVTLVLYNPDTLSEDDIQYAKTVSDWLSSGDTPFGVENVSSIFTNPELESRLISPDKTTMLLNAGLSAVAFESDSISTTESIREFTASAPADLQIYVSGQVGTYSDVYENLAKSIDLTTLITAVLVVVLLIIIYRSPIAALVPLLTIGLAFLTARGITGFIGQAGVSIWSQIEIFLIVLIFGIGTDYCLFLISRFREELKNEADRKAAMRQSIARVGIVIAASALAVVVGLSGLYAADYQMIKTMGPLLGISILITLLAALTLSPALASLFGKILFWPNHKNLNPKNNNSKPGFWHKIADFTTRKPAIVGGIALVVLLLPYLALPGLNRSFDQMAELPESAESIAGFNVLKEHYDIGEMDPPSVLLVAPEGMSLNSPEALSALSRVAAELQSVNHIVKVQYILSPEGSSEPLSELTVSGQLTAIGENLAQYMEGMNSPSADSAAIASGFTLIEAYFSELGQSFNWLADEPVYQSTLAALNDLHNQTEAVMQSALVENQLSALSLQISAFSNPNSDLSAFMQPETQQLLVAFSGYLQELASAYPEITDSTDYQNALAVLSGFQQLAEAYPNMTEEQIAELAASLPDSINLLSQSLANLAQHFAGSGSLLFSQSLAQLSGDSSQQAALVAALAQFQQNLTELNQLFIQKGNPPFLSATLLQSDQQSQNLLSLFFSQDRRATRLYLVLDAYPQSDTALQAVEDARTTLNSALQNTSLSSAEAVIGGTTAELADVRFVLDNDFNRIMIVVLAAVFIVLALLLKSLLAPIYLLITVLISYGTTLGISTWIFQDLLGQSGISFLIPIIILVLLIALGSDYNIFLMSRVREESQGQNTREGVRRAVIATGGVITACGIILAGTFGALVISPIRTLMQIGVTVSIGVLIDTFIVRALLVPSIASLLGRWNWWPAKRK